MASVFMAALLAFAPSPEAAATAGSHALDLRCYRLMAELAEDEDPRIRAAGFTGAQYFLGRIDARAPGFDPEEAPDGEAGSDAERERLIGQCGALMGAGGRDFRAIGERLVRPADRI
jgi:hypothetical protein